MNEVLSYRIKKENIEVEKTQEFIDHWFKQFNKLYFKGKLKNIATWASLKSNDGKFRYRAELATKKIVPICIELNRKTNNDFNEFRDTLVHEMLHYYVDCFLTKIESYQWVEFARLRQSRKRGAYSALGFSSTRQHLGIWLEEAKKLNAKFKELDITSHTHTSQRNMQKIKKEAKNLKLLKIESYFLGDKSRTTYHFISDSTRRKLVKDIKKNESAKNKKDYQYKDYYLYEIDTSKLTQSINETKQGYHLSTTYVSHLKKQKVFGFNTNNKYLGRIYLTTGVK